ncbi:MAG: FAD-dependent oxidoreductase [Spirochaetales bacterium]|nr:FAD-dependent oxidoreductase [Spirochaetales bacterium]
MKDRYYVDAAVIGGSLGGTQAAQSLLEEGYTVFLSEEAEWLGGQLTSQAVPPDEHPWIEEFGCTKKYRLFRNEIRDEYRNNPDFSLNLAGGECFDPGNSTVSRIAHLPGLAYRILMRKMQPYIDMGKLVLVNKAIAVSAGTSADRIEWVRIRSSDTGRECIVYAEYFIDGTDQGDLLPLCGAEYITGAESRKETGEPGAPLKGNPHDMQPVTWVLAMGLNEGERSIKKPELYDYFSTLKQPYDRYDILSRFGPDSVTGKAREFGILEEEKSSGLFTLWDYRRISFPGWYAQKTGEKIRELSLLNWPQNDYFMGNIIENKDWGSHRMKAKQLSLSFLYWLQNHAPGPDGRIGYPEIGLVRDVLGTEDGCAQFPYIREGRRIRALTQIRETDIGAKYHKTIPRRKDSVGIGSYHIDLHITTVSHQFLYDHSWPFEIPLGALIPVRMKNLLAASKNIGTTHLTNSSFRLHPVEWNIGEAAGYLASYCMKKTCRPKDVFEKDIEGFQAYIADRGVELKWPEKQVEIL